MSGKGTGRARKLAVAAAVILATMGVDRIAKHAAASLEGRPPVHLLAGAVTLRYAENRGAMLSLGAGLSEPMRFLLFTAGVGVLLAGIAAYIIFGRNLSGLRAGALALLFAGGASNFIDRVFNEGRVVDFIMVRAGPLATGIFNVADMAIMTGASLYILTMAGRRRMENGESRTHNS